MNPSKPKAFVVHEAAVVASILLAGNAPLPPLLSRILADAPESCYDQRHGEILVRIRDLRQAGKAVFETAVAEGVGFADSIQFISGLMLQALPLELAELEAGQVLQEYKQRRTRALLGEALEAIDRSPELSPGIIKHTHTSLEQLMGNGCAEFSSITKLLTDHQFNHTIQPPPLRPIYTLNSIVIATPKNLVAINAAIKTGKSAVVGAMISSVMPTGDGLDLLGFASSNPDSRALLHFDTEQSPDDHWHLVQRALKRAGRSKPPEWFHSYCLTGLDCHRKRKCVQAAIKIAADRHGGIHSALIDGVADLVADVNDAAECNAFVAELHQLAIEHDCPIAGVIHFNPGGEKVRGHLGSELERKAETNLRLDKNDEVTTIWSEKQRRAPISKGTGPCFKWDDDAGMHISTQTLQATNDKEEKEQLCLLADEIFIERPAMRRTELVTTIKTKQKVSERTADRRVTKMTKFKIIEKSVAGLWARGI